MNSMKIKLFSTNCFVGIKHAIYDKKLLALISDKQKCYFVKDEQMFLTYITRVYIRFNF